MTRFRLTRFSTSSVMLPAALAVAAGLTAVTAAAPANAATTYTVTNLGSLGAGGTVAAGINATGEVTGYSTLSTLVPTPVCVPYGNKPPTCKVHPWHAFAYSNGQMTDLGTVGGGNFSTASAINATGEVAGSSTTKANGGDAFVWDGQKMTDIGQQAPLKGNESRANGINDSGEAVGQYAASGSGQDHAFSYSNGTVTGLPEPKWASDYGCLAFAINNSGQIAGSCDDTSGNQHLMLWDNGKFTNLGIVATASTYYPLVEAVSINASGQIAGWAFDGGVTDGFLYSNGTLTSLGSFAATAINDNGVMVGGPDIDNNGTITDLNTLLPAGSPTIQSAVGINDNGQIAATATIPSDGSVLLTPA